MREDGPSYGSPLLRDRDWDVRWQAVGYFTQIGAGDPEIKERIFELLRDRDWNVRGQAVGYFIQIGAGDPEIKERIFELLKDQSYSPVLGKTVQDAAIEYLSKYAPEESKEKAPNFFKSKDEFTRRGAYKLMKVLLVSR